MQADYCIKMTSQFTIATGLGGYPAYNDDL